MKNRDSAKRPSVSTPKRQSITVKKSFQVSVEDAANTVGQSPIPVASSSHQTNMQRRPDSCAFVSSSPLLSTSNGHIDQHEALTSRLPVFRQSRRWARFYMKEDDQSKPTVTPDTSPRRVRHVLTCDTSQQSAPTTAVDVIDNSDGESACHGLCAPTQLTGRQTLHQHQPAQTCSLPVKVIKTAGYRSPRRTKSTKSLRNRPQPSPRRVLCKAAPGKNKDCDSQAPIPEVPSQHSGHEHEIPFKRPAIFDPARDADNAFTGRANNHVSFPRETQKAGPFLHECGPMISNFDFGNDWSLSVIEPVSSRSRQSATKATDRQTMSKGSDILAASGVNQPADDPSLRGWMSLKHSVVSDAANTVSVQPSYNASTRALSRTDIGGLSNRGEAEVSPLVSIVYSESTATGPSKQKVTKNLKNASSIDTLTLIEALAVQNPPNPVSHRLKDKPSSCTLSVSPKQTRPCGEPPERPLPELPGVRNSPCRRSSSASSRNDTIVQGTIDPVDPFETDRESPKKAALSTSPCRSEAPIATRIVESDEDRATILSPSFAERMHQLKSAMCETSSGASAELVPLAKLKAKGVNIERSNKIQAVKRRHLADLGGTPRDKVKEDNTEAPASFTFSADVEQGHSTTSRDERQPVTNTAKADQSSQNSDNASVFKYRPPPVTDALYTPEEPLTVVSPSIASDDLLISPSKSSPGSRKHRNRSRTTKSIGSSPNPPQRHRRLEISTQVLSRSQLMVIVDTNPHTTSFRAGALSPTPSMIFTDSRPTTPACKRPSKKPSKAMLTTRTVHEQALSESIDNIVELVDIVRPPPSIRERSSSRGLRTKASFTGNSVSSSTTSTLRPNSSADAKPQNQSGLSRRRTSDSSGSEQETVTLPRGKQASPGPKRRSASRASSGRFHSRKNTPLTVILKREVRRADQELETLKQYEKRIESLQSHLEQTLKIWGQMSQRGKREYLTSALGSLDYRDGFDPNGSGKDHETMSVAASSFYSVRSSVQKMDKPTAALPNEALSLTVRKASNESRPTSDTSASTIMCTDTDLDGSSETADDRADHRASGGSMTDPQDYEAPRPSSPPKAMPVTRERNEMVNVKSPLGANLDDFRARLQATTRRPAIPVRRRRLPSPASLAPRSVNTSVPRSISSKSLRVDSPLTSRFATAPWDAQEQAVVGSTGPAGGGHQGRRGQSKSSFLFELQGENLRTDQMDRMLGL